MYNILTTGEADVVIMWAELMLMRIKHALEQRLLPSRAVILNEEHQARARTITEKEEDNDSKEKH